MIFSQRLAFATCLVTLFLIALGTFVRATGSGLGCPDWPLCHGGVVPPTDSHHTIIEFSHRFVASIVGFMVIAVAACAWRFYRHAPLVLGAAFLTVPLVGVQGILGAITVVRELPPEIVATHLVTAMLVLAFELFVAIGMWLEDPVNRERARRVATVDTATIRKLALASAVWLACLMWIGAYMAESGASTACEGWPTCNGSIFPSNDTQEITHMAHRYLALGLGGLLLATVIALRKRKAELPIAGPTALSIDILFGTQVLVGAFNVWLTFPDALTVAHTAIASCIWFVLAGTIVLTYYAPVAARRPLPLTPAEVPV